MVVAVEHRQLHRPNPARRPRVQTVSDCRFSSGNSSPPTASRSGFWQFERCRSGLKAAISAEVSLSFSLR